jgi:hypothetical protein
LLTGTYRADKPHSLYVDADHLLLLRLATLLLLSLQVWAELLVLLAEGGIEG